MTIFWKSIMRKEIFSEFLSEFPELVGTVCFEGNEESIRAVKKNVGCALGLEAEETEAYFKRKIYPHIGNKNRCLSFEASSQTFYFVAIAENFDHVGRISLPLISCESDKSKFQEFAVFHEIGHIILDVLRPESKEIHPFSVFFETDEKCFGEDFADSYASLRFLQKYGMDGLNLVRKHSDLRLLSSLLSKSPLHLTHRVLDEIVRQFFSPDKINEISGLNQKEIAQISLETTDKYSAQANEREADLSKWLTALYTPSFSSLSDPCVERLMEAIENQMGVSLEETENFVGKHGFYKGALSDEFKKSTIMKALIGLSLSLVKHEDMSNVSKLINEFVWDKNKESLKKSANQYPELEKYTKATISGSFGSDRYRLLSAMSDPDFVNDLTYRFLARRTLSNIDAYHQNLRI